MTVVTTSAVRRNRSPFESRYADIWFRTRDREIINRSHRCQDERTRRPGLTERRPSVAEPIAQILSRTGRISSTALSAPASRPKSASGRDSSAGQGAQKRAIDRAGRRGVGGRRADAGSVAREIPVRPGDRSVTGRSPGASDRSRVLIAGVVAAALLGVAVLAVVALTPAYGLPVGTGVTSGDSMGNDGTRVTVFVDVEPEIGDVIVFHGGDRHGYVQHRVVAETDEGLVTKGDAHTHVDQPSASTGSMDFATSENTRGVVVATVPVAHFEAGLVALLAGLLAAACALQRRELATLLSRAARAPRGPGPSRRLLLAITITWAALAALQLVS